MAYIVAVKNAAHIKGPLILQYPLRKPRVYHLLFWRVREHSSTRTAINPFIAPRAAVAPEQKVQPRAWLPFKKASVYKQKDGVIVVIG